MLSILEFVAALSSTLFAGAAIYINLVEHPARMGCDTKTAATVWAPSYKRATLMQASLAILSFLAGVGAWVTGGGVLWLVAALLSHLVAPRRPLTGIIRAAGHANGELTRGVSP